MNEQEQIVHSIEYKYTNTLFLKAEAGRQGNNRPVPFLSQACLGICLLFCNKSISALQKFRTNANAFGWLGARLLQDVVRKLERAPQCDVLLFLYFNTVYYSL